MRLAQAAVVGIRPFTITWHDTDYKITELISAEPYGRSGAASYNVQVRSGDKQFEFICDQRNADLLLRAQGHAACNE